MHPNYIMNNGGATQEDILEIKEKIQKAVKEKFDVDLEQEVTIVEF
jgi:UDP-N-acetylenolpyruvoylglucosamine reductase